MGDFFMFDDKGPLLYINTAQTEAIPQNQNVYDSRQKKEVTKYFDMRKLHNILEMYNKNKPVFCRLYIGNKQIEGIPYRLNNHKLDILVEGKNCSLDINALTDIEIIRI